MAEQTGVVWYLYQARRVNTQTAGGGGALGVSIALANGQMGKIVSANIIGPAAVGAALDVWIDDEDAAQAAYLGSIAAGAARTMRLPSIGTASTGSSNQMYSANLILAPGQALRVLTGTANQTETLTVAVVMLLNTSTEPTWATTGSGGTPSLAANTISAANAGPNPVFLPA